MVNYAQQEQELSSTIQQRTDEYQAAATDEERRALRKRILARNKERGAISGKAAAQRKRIKEVEEYARSINEQVKAQKAAGSQSDTYYRNLQRQEVAREVLAKARSGDWNPETDWEDAQLRSRMYDPEASSYEIQRKASKTFKGREAREFRGQLREDRASEYARKEAVKQAAGLTEKQYKELDKGSLKALEKAYASGSLISTKRARELKAFQESGLSKKEYNKLSATQRAEITTDFYQANTKQLAKYKQPSNFVKRREQDKAAAAAAYAAAPKSLTVVQKSGEPLARYTAYTATKQTPEGLVTTRSLKKERLGYYTFQTEQKAPYYKGLPGKASTLPLTTARTEMYSGALTPKMVTTTERDVPKVTYRAGMPTSLDYFKGGAITTTTTLTPGSKAQAQLASAYAKDDKGKQLYGALGTTDEFSVTYTTTEKVRSKAVQNFPLFTGKIGGRLKETIPGYATASEGLRWGGQRLIYRGETYRWKGHTGGERRQSEKIAGGFLQYAGGLTKSGAWAIDNPDTAAAYYYGGRAAGSLIGGGTLFALSIKSVARRSAVAGVTKGLSFVGAAGGVVLAGAEIKRSENPWATAGELTGKGGIGFAGYRQGMRKSFSNVFGIRNTKTTSVGTRTQGYELTEGQIGYNIFGRQRGVPFQQKVSYTSIKGTELSKTSIGYRGLVEQRVGQGIGSFKSKSPFWLRMDTVSAPTIYRGGAYDGTVIFRGQKGGFSSRSYLPDKNLISGETFMQGRRTSFFTGKTGGKGVTFYGQDSGVPTRGFLTAAIGRVRPGEFTAFEFQPQTMLQPRAAALPKSPSSGGIISPFASRSFPSYSFGFSLPTAGITGFGASLGFGTVGTGSIEKAKSVSFARNVVLGGSKSLYLPRQRTVYMSEPTPVSETIPQLEVISMVDTGVLTEPTTEITPTPISDPLPVIPTPPTPVIPPPIIPGFPGFGIPPSSSGKGKRSRTRGFKYAPSLLGIWTGAKRKGRGKTTFGFGIRGV